jgi:hypothetical protein
MGVGRDAKRIGGFFLTKVTEIAVRDDQPIAFRQFEQRAQNGLSATLRKSGRFGRRSGAQRWHIRRRARQKVSPTPGGVSDCSRLIGDDAQQPRSEGTIGPETRHCDKRACERVLNCVFCVRAITQDDKRGAERNVAVALHEIRICLAVATLCLSDEL